MLKILVVLRMLNESLMRLFNIMWNTPRSLACLCPEFSPGFPQIRSKMLNLRETLNGPQITGHQKHVNYLIQTQDRLKRRYKIGELNLDKRFRNRTVQINATFCSFLG